MNLAEHYNQELYHYGVKGMKWGVRRKQVMDNISQRRLHNAQVKSEKKQFKRDVKLAKRGQYHDPHDLSFTADTKQHDDGSFSLDNIRYYSGKKRISEKKYNELQAYTNKVYSQVAKDAEKGRKRANAILYGQLGVAAVAALAGGIYAAR